MLKMAPLANNTLIFIVLVFSVNCYGQPIKTADSTVIGAKDNCCRGLVETSVPEFGPEWEKCNDTSKYFGKEEEQKPDARNITEMLKPYGFTCETHMVTTTDGYILAIHRIVNPFITSTSKIPVYISHGMNFAADSWFLQEDKQRTLPIMLTMRGFDVWVGNARGTTASLNHTTYDYIENWREYWDFSFEEMAVFDLPSITDVILEKTGRNKILYVGFSMGATQALVGLSEVAELNQKIHATFLMSPLAFLRHSTLAFRTLAEEIQTYEDFQNLNKVVKGFVGKQNMNLIATDTCAISAELCGMCDNSLLKLYGYNAPQMQLNSVSNMMEHGNHASFKTMVHFMQWLNSCKFQKFDYTPEINLKKYGRSTAPDYKIDNIKTDMYIYYAAKDRISTTLDVNLTASRIKQEFLKGLYLVPDAWFTHLDFTIAKDADNLVYNKIITDMMATVQNNPNGFSDI